MHLFTNWIKQKWKIEFECKCFPLILKVKYYASISWKFILLSRWILVQFKSCPSTCSNLSKDLLLTKLLICTSTNLQISVYPKVNLHLHVCGFVTMHELLETNSNLACFTCVDPIMDPRSLSITDPAGR